MRLPWTASQRKDHGTVIELSEAVSGYLKELASSDRVNSLIHKDDEMFVFTLGKKQSDRDLSASDYFETGKRIADSVGQLVRWKFGGFQNVNRFLDFASGYGRVTRFLVQEIGPERVWVSDISASAVEFQKETFGVHGFVSVRQPKALEVTERFDCILVCSLFSHLPESTFVPWLEKLYSLLAPNGLLIITTHDESLRGAKPNDGPVFWFSEESEIDTLDKKEYGSTFVNEHYVRAAIKGATAGRGSYFRIPKGLNRYQDLYLIAGPPEPDFSTLDYSFGPPGYVDAVSLLERDLLEVTGWAFDLSGLKIDEIQVTVEGGLIQKCVPSLKRPDVAQHFKNPSAELSGFSCVVRLHSDASAMSAALLTVFAMVSGGESFLIYKNRLGSALQLRHR
jgi:SAM-dependent methyltransferase